MSTFVALTELEAEVIVSAYRHRLLSTSQIHRLHTPQASMRWTQMLLARLEDAGYLARVRARTAKWAGRESLWWGTDIGADAAETGEDVTERRYRMSAQRALGPLQAHTLATNDVGAAFVTAARTLGHECSPADWDHEIAFRIADRPTTGPGSDLVVVDAVLHYTIHWPEGDELLCRFVEVDRGTETVGRLAAKLRSYAALYDYVPKPTGRDPDNGPRLAGWHTQFLAFPKVLVVLCGRPADQLQRRRDTLLELCRHDPALGRLAARVSISVTTLAELTAEGPFAPIFASPFVSGAHDVVGDAPEPAHPDADQPKPASPATVAEVPGQLRLVTGDDLP